MTTLTIFFVNNVALLKPVRFVFVRFFWIRERELRLFILIIRKKNEEEEELILSAKRKNDDFSSSF